MPSGVSPAFSVTSSNTGMPFRMPRLMNNLFGTLSRQGVAKCWPRTMSSRPSRFTSQKQTPQTILSPPCPPASLKANNSREPGISEVAVAIVEEQRVERAGAEENVRPAVVIHIGHGDAEARSDSGNADGIGHVFELPVTLIAEETGAFRFRAVVTGERVFTDENIE